MTRPRPVAAQPEPRDFVTAGPRPALARRPAREARGGARRFGLVVAAALAFASTGAWAQKPPEPYVVKFTEGRKLVEEGKFTEALAKFQGSLALKEASGTLLNIGDCQEHLGQYASASISFERARSLAAEEKKPEREKEAADRANKLEPLISKLTVKTVGADKITVTVDGGPVEIGQPVSVDGGAHNVHAEIACKRAKDFPVKVGVKGDLQTMTIDPATFDPDPACIKEPPKQGPSTERILAYAAGGAGVVAAAFGVGFGISASGKKSDVENLCPTFPDHCPIGRKPEIDAKYDSAHSAATWSTVMFAGAILLIGGGVALYILSPESKNAQTAFVPGRWTF